MKRLLPYIIIEAAVYNLLPLVAFLPSLRDDLGAFIALLFIYYPLSSLMCPLIYGIKYGFSCILILACAILFIPAMFIYFNSSAWVYMIPYTILAFAGNAVGILIHKKRSST